MRRRTLVALVLIAGLFSVPHAAAATTIGNAWVDTGGLACNYGGTFVQTGSTNAVHTVPYDGVITSWGSRGFFETATFKVARPGQSGAYTVVASDGPRTHASGFDLETYPVRFPARQGDVLGVRVPTALSTCFYESGSFTYGLDSEDVSVGGEGFLDSTGGGQIPVQATVERDRDGDGFGDETQDACPTNAATQGRCPLPTVLGETDFLPVGGGDPSGRDHVVINSLEAKVTVPEDGVVSSWSYRAGTVVDGTIKAKMFRPLGGTDYRSVGSSQAQVPAANVINTFPARIPVRQGDKLGVQATGIPVASNFSDSGNTFASVTGDLADGATATFTPGASRRINISAVVEADADGDGFGDTSQDQCPTDASTQAACAGVSPPPGDDACEKARAKLKRAKAKLKKLKRKDAVAKKLKTAKKKIKKAKAAVRKAC